ncbi:imm11 family protein [Xanthobacter flavus]|uniref:imm11 family protein n=1 Tax=Xanthobacter flavus TaxID=281 RepID=UPI00372B32ED
MDHAYMIDHLIDMKRYVSGEFTGGDEGRVEEIEYDGIKSKFNLESCLKFRVWAPESLRTSAPSRITIKTRSKNPPDFGFGPWGEFRLVSEPFVDIVEDLDPGVHQFIKIPETYISGEIKIDKYYYIMNVINTIDALDVENSNVIFDKFRTHNNSDIGYVYLMKIAKPFKISLFRDKIGSANMWRGSRRSINRLFFSKKLVE